MEGALLQEWPTTKEAAAQIRCSEATVRRLIIKGVLRIQPKGAGEVRRHVLIDPDSIERFKQQK